MISLLLTVAVLKESFQLAPNVCLKILLCLCCNDDRWKDILERTLADLDREIASLSDSKDALEQSLEAKNLPTEVNVENLVTREGRQDIDVVEDEVEDQLKKVSLIAFHCSICARCYEFVIDYRLVICCSLKESVDCQLKALYLRGDMTL